MEELRVAPHINQKQPPSSSFEGLMFERSAFYVFGSNLTLVNSFEIKFLSHVLTDSASLKTRLFIIEVKWERSDLLSFCFVLQGSASS